MTTQNEDDVLIETVKAYVESYMSQFDASHDYAHISRVLDLAMKLQFSEQSLHPGRVYNPTIVILGALLHNVGDKKYLSAGQDAATMVSSFLLTAGCQSGLAATVQSLVTHVSFSFEKKNPAKVQAMIAQIPELAIVQDADRLDAIGAVGIGRCFAFTGAKGGAGGLKSAVEHFEEKLETLEGMMKTDSGRTMARTRTARLKMFREWWEEEVTVS